MPWYLWLVVIWQSVLILLTILVAGRTVQVQPSSPVSLIIATVLRGLTTWALIAAGASIPWTIVVTIVAFLDLIGDGYNAQHKRSTHLGPGALLIGLALYGGTVALALTAGH